MNQNSVLHTVKWFQVLLFKYNNSINHLFEHNQMISSIAIYRLHIVKWFQVLLFKYNNSINYLFAHKWFQVLPFIVCTQLNGFRYSK